MNVIAELTMVTYDIGPSLSPFVAKVLALIRQDECVKHLLTPMGTVIEGEWSDVMALIDRLMNTLAPDFERIGLTLKVDYHRGRTDRITGKVASVLSRIDA